MEFGAYSRPWPTTGGHSPQEDLMTSLVQAEVDGEKLTSTDITSFFMLLAIAGTRPPATRSATASWR